MSLLLLLSTDAWAACTLVSIYRDADGDGYGIAALSQRRCRRLGGYPGWSPRSTDCDDTNAAVHPTAAESCNGVDDDCDGAIDGGSLTYTTWYLDGDADGFGDAATAVSDCAEPAGYVGDDTDCDDVDAAIWPGADEVCDELDNDCDAEVDESPIDGLIGYADVDEDGYGDLAAPVSGCTLPVGAVEDWGDCDDASAAVHPGAIDICDELDEDCNGVDDGCPAYTVAWGDLHNHTNLSPDGCEEEADDCLPTASTPGELTFAAAYEAGLDFAAITEHAEMATYEAGGVPLDIWDVQKAWVAAAEAGPVVPILGYEWTSNKGHRTVLFEDSAACADYRVHAAPMSSPKSFLGHESYTASTSDTVVMPADLMDKLAAAATNEGCTATRVISYFHHPAMSPPQSIDWNSETALIDGDTVVEIASEHGTSECADLEADGCDFRVRSATYAAEGSVQTALQLGRKLGFVGGSDNHEGRPGTMDDGPGPIAYYDDNDGDGVGDAPRHNYTNGAVTGVIYTGDLGRSTVFDAIEARHTFAATWLFEGVLVYAYDASGTTYLPGDNIPASAGELAVVVQLDDPLVESWTAELVDPYNTLQDVTETFSLASGDVRYVRVRAWVGGVEERIWASPFFGL